MTARHDRAAMGRSIAASWRAAGFALPYCPACGVGSAEPCRGRPPYGLHADRLRLMGRWPVEAFHRLPVAKE